MDDEKNVIYLDEYIRRKQNLPSPNENNVLKFPARVEKNVFLPPKTEKLSALFTQKTAHALGAVFEIYSLLFNYFTERPNLNKAREQIQSIFPDEKQNLEDWTFVNSNKLRLPRGDLMNMLASFGETANYAGVPKEDSVEIAKKLTELNAKLKKVKGEDNIVNAAHFTRLLSDGTDKAGGDETANKLRFYKNYYNLQKQLEPVEKQFDDIKPLNAIFDLGASSYVNYHASPEDYLIKAPIKSYMAHCKDFSSGVRYLQTQMPSVEEIARPEMKFFNQQDFEPAETKTRFEPQNVTNNNITNNYNINNRKQQGVDIEQLLRSYNNRPLFCGP